MSRLLPFLLLGCDGDDGKGDDPADTDTDADTDSDTDVDTDTDTDADTDTDTPPPVPPAFTAAPTLRANPTAGLTVWLDAALDRPATLDVTVDTDGRTWTVSAPEADVHALLILGLRPDRDYTLTVVATADEVAADPVVVNGHADPLPADMIRPTVAQADLTRIEPGVTLFSSGDGYTVMVDADGVPCWWADTPSSGHEIRLWTDQTVALVAGRDRFDRLGLDGALVQRFTTQVYDGAVDPIAVAVDPVTFHHDFVPLPNGNLLALSIERRRIPFRTSETDEAAPFADQWVAGDIVVELAPNGALIDQWRLFDLLDPERVAYDSITGDYWYNFANWRGDETRDWLHVNSVDYDAATDTIVVSMRHQDAVVGISRATGELLWILGPRANWQAPWDDLLLAPPPQAPTVNYHQHSAKMTVDGTLMLFDNGNRRASAFEMPIPQNENWSRALELRVLPANGTYDIVWEWHDERLFSGSLSGVDKLPLTGNRLIVYGNLATGASAGRMLEVTDAGAVVWDYQLPTVGAWFRAHRVTGLIPGPGR